MPGPLSHIGARRHVRIARNQADQAYGATPSPLDLVWVPLLGDGFKAKASAPRYVPDTNYGGDYLRHVALHHREVVEGDITTLLWPEVTALLLGMALNRVADGASPNYQDLYGHVVEHHTPIDPRRHYGVVANTLRLACTGTGDNEVQLTLSLIGQREEEIVAVAPDYSGITPSPFMFAHARLTVEGVTVTDVDAWTLSVENNVGDAPFLWDDDLAVAVRTHAIANLRTVSVELTKLDNQQLYNRAIRRGDDLTFEALFTHPLGHILQITLPSCYVEEAEEDGTPSQQAKTSPTLHARAADGGPHAGCDIVWAVALEGDGSTTFAPMTTTTTAAPTTTTTTAP